MITPFAVLALLSSQGDTTRYPQLARQLVEAVVELEVRQGSSLSRDRVLVDVSSFRKLFKAPVADSAEWLATLLGPHPEWIETTREKAWQCDLSVPPGTGCRPVPAGVMLIYLVAQCPAGKAIKVGIQASWSPSREGGTFYEGMVEKVANQYLIKDMKPAMAPVLDGRTPKASGCN